MLVQWSISVSPWTSTKVVCLDRETHGFGASFGTILSKKTIWLVTRQVIEILLRYPHTYVQPSGDDDCPQISPCWLGQRGNFVTTGGPWGQKNTDFDAVFSLSYLVYFTSPMDEWGFSTVKTHPSIAMPSVPRMVPCVPLFAWMVYKGFTVSLQGGTLGWGGRDGWKPIEEIDWNREKWHQMRFLLAEHRGFYDWITCFWEHSTVHKFCFLNFHPPTADNYQRSPVIWPSGGFLKCGIPKSPWVEKS